MAINIDNSNTGTLTFSPPSSGGNYTLTFPSTAGTNGDALYIDASGNLVFGTASLLGFTTAINNTGVNATVFVTSITASGGSTNQHFALMGSDQFSSLLMLAIPDGTTTGGDARSNSSLDFQMSRSASNQVASGVSANLIGTYLTTAGEWSTAIGCNQSGIYNSSSGLYQNVAIAASSLGGTTPVDAQTSLNTCTNFYNSGYTNEGNFQFTSTGYWLSNVSQAAHVFSCRELSTNANSQIATRRLLWALTSAGSPSTVLTADGNALTLYNGLRAQNTNTCQLLEVRYVGVGIVAGISVTPTDFLVGYVQIFATKGATAATQTATAISNTVIQSGGAGAGWSVSIGANTTLGCPTITANGSSSSTVRWIAFIMTAEVAAQA